MLATHEAGHVLHAMVSGGRVTHVAGLSDAENALRLAASPDPDNRENPVLTGPPAIGSGALKVQFVTNDPRLNEPGADDDLDRNEDDVDVDASLLVFHLGRATRFR